MPNRNWTPEQCEEQSKLIQEQKPWLYSTGPRTLIGKYRSRMNALKHGFNSESLQEFRQMSRQSETRVLEKTCKDLIWSINRKHIQDAWSLIEQLERNFQSATKILEESDESSQSSVELYYVIVITVKTLNFSLLGVLRNLTDSSESRQK